MTDSFDPPAAVLLSTTDARVWAAEWCRVARDLEAGDPDLRFPIDENWMTTWFANAMAVAVVATQPPAAVRVQLPVFDWRADTPVHEAVFEALGAVSSCWSSLEAAGVFDAGRASAIGEELMAFLRSKLWVDDDG